MREIIATAYVMLRHGFTSFKLDVIKEEMHNKRKKNALQANEL